MTCQALSPDMIVYTGYSPKNTSLQDQLFFVDRTNKANHLG